MIFTQMLCTPDALVESVVHVRPNHEPLLSRPLTVHQAWLCYRKFAYSVFVDVYMSGQLLSSDSTTVWLLEIKLDPGLSPGPLEAQVGKFGA